MILPPEPNQLRLPTSFYFNLVALEELSNGLEFVCLKFFSTQMEKLLHFLSKLKIVFETFAKAKTNNLKCIFFIGPFTNTYQLYIVLLYIIDTTASFKKNCTF